MKLEPLYRVRFTYPEGWAIKLNGSDSTESQNFFFAEGQCEGRITGQLRGTNHPLRRGDGTYLPNFQGIITTEDDAIIYFDLQRYGLDIKPKR